MKRAIMKYAASALGIAAMLAPAVEVYAAPAIEKDGDKYYYQEDGETVKTASGLKNVDGKWYYIEDGEWISDKYGFVEHNNNKFLIANGVVADKADGIQQDPDDTKTWYFCSAGQAQLNYSGMAEYDNAWFLLKKGVLDTSVSDFVEYDGGLFFIAAGRLVKEQNGLAMDPDDPTSWYYCANGQAQTDYTGLASYDGEWFYIVDGKQAIDYTGEVEYDGASFYVVNGMVGEKPAPTPTATPTPTPTAAPTPTPSQGKTYSRWRQTTRKYFEKGELVEVTRYEYVSANSGTRSGSKVYDADNNLKSYTVITRDGGATTTKYFNADGTLDRYTVDQSNDKGYTYSYYNSDGVLYNFEKYEYFETPSGTTSLQVEGAIQNEAKDAMIGKTVYEYDSLGHRVKETDTYTSVNKADSETVYQYNSDFTAAEVLVDGVKARHEEYDSEGALLRQERYNADGTMKDYYTFTYNEKHEESSRMWYNADGSLKYGYKYSYSYNSDGKIQEETSTRVNSDGTEKLSGRYVYTYDKNGNRSAYIRYGSDDKESARYEYEYEKYTYTK